VKWRLVLSLWLVWVALLLALLLMLIPRRVPAIDAVAASTAPQPGWHQAMSGLVALHIDDGSV
jgi:hypothetical protein